MKIYIVKHHYDNGESYEDRMDFIDEFFYSTEARAKLHYTYAIYDGVFEGQWQLIEKTLDTQEENVLFETEYNECHSDWDNYCGEYDHEDYDPYDPMNDAESAFRYLDSEEKDEYSDKYYIKGVGFEKNVIEEYLTTPHELFEIFAEIEADKQRRLSEEISNELDNYIAL